MTSNRHQTENRMKNKTLIPYGILMLYLAALPFTTLADLMSNTERLNQWMDQLHSERILRERLPWELELVDIPDGCFQMGSNNVLNDENPVHEVCVKGFRMGKYEVTQGQWRAVMGNNPSHFDRCDDNCPVEKVSWDDIQRFLQQLNSKTALNFRLPSEAEWEYACRGGWANEAYCGGNDAGRVGWYDKNGGRKTHAVGGKVANNFGLYDMSGNVWEWTDDCWNVNYHGAPADGSTWQRGDCQRRVLRGGSWDSNVLGLRTTFRLSTAADNRLNDIGFRLLLQVRP